LKNENFSLPGFTSNDETAFETEDCFHPLLPDAVPNSFKFEHPSTLAFLTGPNMSGKSTFLKTLGVLTYFAHLGLPVPAKKLVIPVFNGLFTTINLSDSISQGFSHFYSEVNRLKEMSSSLKNSKKLVVILDELFRGTNVKDAQEGTHMIIDMLSKIKGSLFFISTHILEVAENLEEDPLMKFICFESGLKNGSPVYDYKLKPGISAERVGMQIIEDAGIVKILSEIIKKQ
jgi:DNA mismatch repair ATPase MutS